jgi:DnaJ-class molecular chaperone
MKTDYYEILNIKRVSTEEQISTAFKKTALKHHPLRNPENMKIHEAKFHEICEAYQVLSNPQLKTIYD